MFYKPNDTSAEPSCSDHDESMSVKTTIIRSREGSRACESLRGQTGIWRKERSLLKLLNYDIGLPPRAIMIVNNYPLKRAHICPHSIVIASARRHGNQICEREKVSSRSSTCVPPQIPTPVSLSLSLG